MPDVADLRLLGEIINHGAVGLPQAAWNAGMSQSEAAARLVTMAERGMPLRLVAEGDRQQLWQIAQAGPAASVPAVPPPAPVLQLPEVPPAAITGPISTVPPAPAIPPNHEPASVWGVPGTSDWVRPPEENPTPTSHPADNAPDGTDPADSDPAPGVEPVSDSEPVPDSDPVPGSGPTDTPAGHTGALEPTRRVLTSGEPVQPVVGLFGEQLDVGLQQILDPADNILTAVGYRIDENERALLVQTSVGNRGPVAYESLADLYLEVVDAGGIVLRKAAMAVAGYPAHTVGVPANTLVSAWTVFLVPVGTEVAEVRWSIRPDLSDRTVSWVFGPAPESSIAAG